MFSDGQVFDFAEGFTPPPHFRALDDEFDFGEASRDELLATKWTYKAIDSYCQEHFKVSMPKGSKTEMVNKFLDIKLRHVEG
jgi:hypothetical protein